jgi:tRNA threonylcarbamoyladenosine biosynthesis protein TsaB
MRLLAFDTSTDTLSVAVVSSAGASPGSWQTAGAGGAQASSRLIPEILDLMARAGLTFAELDAIVFGRGPGAFTGLRTACSVAQGLGFGTQGRADGQPVPLLPVDTLLAVAEEARQRHAPGNQPLRVFAMLDARMDQLYAAAYRFDGTGWQQQGDIRLERPENLLLDATWGSADCVLAGNVFAAYGERLVFGASLVRIEALPTASAMLRLAPALLAAGFAVIPELALPLYIRDKVAQTSSERAAAKAAAPSP